MTVLHKPYYVLNYQTTNTNSSKEARCMDSWWFYLFMSPYMHVSLNTVSCISTIMHKNIKLDTTYEKIQLFIKSYFQVYHRQAK